MNAQHRIDVANGKALEFAIGDITRETTDAIVNAANSSLLGGGGVDGAIHRTGGPEILAACKELRATKYPNGLPTGQAVATTGGCMQAKYVIHTVGPMWGGGKHNEPELLASCYRESIRAADQLQLTSISFPSISTGAYGYPVETAAPIAVSSAREALADARYVQQVRFVLFSDSDFEIYCDCARRAGGSPRK